jgi:hypothetical protein
MEIACAWVLYLRYGCNGPSLYVDSAALPALWFEIDIDEVRTAPAAGTGTAIRGRFGSRGQQLSARFRGTVLEVASDESPLVLRVAFDRLERVAGGRSFEIPATPKDRPAAPPGCAAVTLVRPDTEGGTNICISSSIWGGANGVRPGAGMAAHDPRDRVPMAAVRAVGGGVLGAGQIFDQRFH